MFLSPEEFAAAILIAGLVQVTQVGKVWCRKEALNEFVAEVPDFNSVELRRNCVEITRSYVSTKSFIRRNISDIPINAKMDIIRIGMLSEGETVIASLQYRDCVRPPSRFLLRSAQRDLKEALHPHVQELIQSNDSNLLSVMEWVDMEQLRERVPVAAANVPVVDLEEGNEKLPATSDAPNISTPNTAAPAIDTEQVTDPDATTGRKSTTEAEKLAQLYPSLYHHNLIGMIDRSGDEAMVIRNEAMMSGILTDILRFKINNNEPIGMSSWSTSGVVHDFISVPESISEDDFNRNAKRTGWLDEVLDKCGSDDHSAVRNLLLWLIERHEESTRATLVEKGVIPKVLTAYKVAATMESVGIGTLQWRTLVKCLKTFLGLSAICVSEEVWMLIGHKHGKVSTGRYDWQKVEGHRAIPIDWWTLDPESELILRLNDGANGEKNDSFNPRDIESIFAIYSGDHGKGKHTDFYQR